MDNSFFGFRAQHYINSKFFPQPMQPTLEPTPLQKARLLPDSIEAIEALRKLATDGFYEPQLDDNNDVIGIVINEILWDGPVTPEMAENGIDQKIVGEETTIVANLAWDRDGNELERIDANVYYLCRLHNLFPSLVARLRGAERRAVAAEEKLALIRATATRGVPCLINLAAIDRILDDKPKPQLTPQELAEFDKTGRLLEDKEPRTLPTKEALAEALSKRYGGQVQADDIRGLMPFGDTDNAEVHVQATRDCRTDWYQVTINSAGQIDHTSITQLPF